MINAAYENAACVVLTTDVTRTIMGQNLCIDYPCSNIMREEKCCFHRTADMSNTISQIEQTGSLG